MITPIYVNLLAACYCTALGVYIYFVSNSFFLSAFVVHCGWNILPAPLTLALAMWCVGQ